MAKINWKSKGMVALYFAIGAMIVTGTVLFLIRSITASGFDWKSNRAIAIYIAVGVFVAPLVLLYLGRKTLRTRRTKAKQLTADPDTHDWLVVFNWTPKILYIPTILAALAAGLISYAGWGNPKIIGGIFLAIFLLNLTVDEFVVSIKLLLIGILSVGLLFLWLHMGGWVGGFLRLFKRVNVYFSPQCYLLAAAVGILIIFISWLKGLFDYVVITPNYLNIQIGPTEEGHHIKREDFNSRVDTGDFVERLMGFGRIVITFKDPETPPLIILVWRIGKKTKWLEQIIRKLTIDWDPGSMRHRGVDRRESHQETKNTTEQT